MNSDEHPVLLPANPQWAIFANVAAMAWIVLCLAMLWFAFAADSRQMASFVAPDVALVCLISVIPCGLISARLAKDLSGSSSQIQGILCWTAGVIALVLVSQRNNAISIGTEGTLGHLGRPALALMLMAPSVWLWASFHGARSSVDSRWLVWLLTTWLVALALPSTYIIARCRRDVAHLQMLRDQSRFGEAAIVAHRLLRLAPGTLVQGQPVARVAADIDRAVRKLQSAVAVVPPANASDDDWLLRARQLAMLGQTDAALDALAAVRIPRPNIHLLSGTIHENCQRWQEALDDYSLAHLNWEAQPNSPQRQAGRIQATTGVAYCLRKQGRYLEAEQSYQRLLALAPDADVHFLLAQFYEDTQQTTLARQHAQRAMALAPDQYQQSGQRLINKLTTMHFGCFKMLSTPTGD